MKGLKIIKVITTCLVAVILLQFTSCYYDVAEKLYPIGGDEVEKTTYSGDIAPIISTSCAIAGCHVEGGLGVAKNIKLDTYDDLITRVNNGTFKREVLDQQSMPPSFSLEPIDLQKIEFWLNAGAPNN